MTILAIVWGRLDGAFIAAWITVGMQSARHHSAHGGGERNHERDGSFHHSSGDN